MILGLHERVRVLGIVRRVRRVGVLLVMNTRAPSRDCRQRLRTLGYAAQAAAASLHGGTILLILLSAPLYTHFFSIFSIFSIAIRLAYSAPFPVFSSLLLRTFRH